MCREHIGHTPFGDSLSSVHNHDQCAYKNWSAQFHSFQRCDWAQKFKNGSREPNHAHLRNSSQNWNSQVQEIQQKTA